MRKHPFMFLFGGLFLLLFLMTGITLGVEESHRRGRLSYKAKQGARRLQALLGMS